jgi:integrase
MPCTIRLLPIPKPSAGFYDFDDYDRLVEAARAEPDAYLIVLLGREAGLRCGEIMALEWADVDLSKRQVLRSAFTVESACQRSRKVGDSVTCHSRSV